MSEGKEAKEHDFWSTYFTFKLNFLKFNNRFSWLVKQMFLNSYQYIRSYNTLSYNALSCRCNAITQAIFFDMDIQPIKIYCLELRRL